MREHHRKYKNILSSVWTCSSVRVNVVRVSFDIKLCRFISFSFSMLYICFFVFVVFQTQCVWFTIFSLLLVHSLSLSRSFGVRSFYCHFPQSYEEQNYRFVAHLLVERIKLERVGSWIFCLVWVSSVTIDAGTITKPNRNPCSFLHRNHQID